jgi:hypothetical protein
LEGGLGFATTPKHKTAVTQRSGLRLTPGRRLEGKVRSGTKARRRTKLRSWVSLGHRMAAILARRGAFKVPVVYNMIFCPADGNVAFLRGDR